MRAGCAASDGEKGVTAFLWNMSEIFDRISLFARDAVTIRPKFRELASSTTTRVAIICDARAPFTFDA